MGYNKEQFEKNYSLAVSGMINSLNLIRGGNESAPYRIETILNMTEISKESLEDEIKKDILLRKRFERIYEYKKEFKRLAQ